MDRLEARGQNGTVTFDGAVVTLARWRRPERQLAVGGIADVELRPAGALVSGFIEFRAPDARRAGGAGENAVVFGRRQGAQFAALRDAVQAAMGHEAVGSGEAGGGSVADELTKLAHLVELELLTREEFDAQKAKLLKG